MSTNGIDIDTPVEPTKTSRTNKRRYRTLLLVAAIIVVAVGVALYIIEQRGRAAFDRQLALARRAGQPMSMEEF